MRPLLKYGVPIAGGLAAAGYAASQGEDPGSALLAGIAGGAGAAGGLVGARALAGKYAPSLAAGAQKRVIGPMGDAVLGYGANLPAESKVRMGAVNKAADILAAAERSALGPGSTRLVGKLAGGLGVPAAAGLAGLGGVAAGAIPGSMGVPGFQQQVVDPESYGSSNSPGARYKAPTMQYV